MSSPKSDSSLEVVPPSRKTTAELSDQILNGKAEERVAAIVYMLATKDVDLAKALYANAETHSKAIAEAIIFGSLIHKNNYTFTKEPSSELERLYLEDKNPKRKGLITIASLTWLFNESKRVIQEGSFKVVTKGREFNLDLFSRSVLYGDYIRNIFAEVKHPKVVEYILKNIKRLRNQEKIKTPTLLADDRAIIISDLISKVGGPKFEHCFDIVIDMLECGKIYGFRGLKDKKNDSIELIAFLGLSSSDKAMKKLLEIARTRNQRVKSAVARAFSSTPSRRGQEYLIRVLEIEMAEIKRCPRVNHDYNRQREAAKSLNACIEANVIRDDILSRFDRWKTKARYLQGLYDLC